MRAQSRGGWRGWALWSALMLALVCPAFFAGPIVIYVVDPELLMVAVLCGTQSGRTELSVLGLRLRGAIHLGRAVRRAVHRGRRPGRPTAAPLLHTTSSPTALLRATSVATDLDGARLPEHGAVRPGHVRPARGPRGAARPRRAPRASVRPRRTARWRFPAPPR